VRAHGREARETRRGARAQHAIGFGWLGRGLRREMTTRPHPSARHRERGGGLGCHGPLMGRRWAAQLKKGELGRGVYLVGLREDLGQKQRIRKGVKNLLAILQKGSQI
jgi:hypothetical protein